MPKIIAISGAFPGTLLDSTRLDTGKLCLRPRPMAIHSVIARAVASMTLQAQEKGIQLQQSIAPELPLVCIDEPRMAQVPYLAGSHM